MKIVWLGHSGFRIEIEGAVLLIDPWLTGNPLFPVDRRAEDVDKERSGEQRGPRYAVGRPGGRLGICFRWSREG